MFLNDPKFRWETINTKDSSLSYRGAKEFAQKILNASNKIDTLEKIFKEIDRYSSGVVETPDHIIAWVDHIRSWPLFYTKNGSRFALSNNARKIQNKYTLSLIDSDSCLEFAMSGYVSGKKTLYKKLNCLQPGEFLIWNKTTHKLILNRYHQYRPVMNDKSQNRHDNKKTLGKILDHLTLKVIARANNRPIWIPLSGGLDSRILLCKLHEHGYKNIHTFTYGPHFNFEAGIAKKVAKKLGVSWIFISPSKTKIKQYFSTQTRKNFWNETDGLKAIPSMREFSALMSLREQNLVPDDAIFLNGQSGDYITGNHISKKWTENKEFTEKDFLNILIEKHYDLWSSLKTKTNIGIIEKRIVEILPRNWKKSKTGIEWASLEEIWEYDARQICLVANGQKSYDFFGYDWEMPLWEKELVDFCETLPFDQKIGQSLYKEYLRDYNYKGLFPEKEPYIWRWPLTMLWVVPIAQIIRLVKGQSAKHNFYALMRYHGHYSNQFYSFSWKTHKKTFSKARNVMSLNVREWIKENSSIFSSDIKKRLFINNVD